MAKNVVVGVTGGIAAYKAVILVSKLKKLGLHVDVIMTKNAMEFVTPLSFETISQNPVTTDTFARERSWEVEHISLARKADLFVVAPATANIIAKLAQGIADDMLTTTLLATKAPILMAPAMNTVMWQAEITQKNVQTLQDRGVMMITPDSGLLACGEVGEGRMAEPEHIADEVQRLLSLQNDLTGLRVLVTAGATREKLDPVRFISNPSTGKMGYALAEAAKERGAEVLLISGPTALSAPAGVELKSIQTTQDLYTEMLANAPQYDIVVQAAAPSDYRFMEQSEQKIKKSAHDITLTMVPTPDVAKAVGERKTSTQVLVGFAAETGGLVENARKKLVSKNLDIVVANDVTKPGAGFGTDTNIATLITRDTEASLAQMSKRALADRVLDSALAIFKTRSDE
ncbi:MAG TPA: bifunctional phosphopantothenoylcysteine decarboxylase/phosphopantothenate--cysteine ligase CoaBC [Candidatus Limiplasma sp.]|nr:bifunctional phosphopantothenoylcysteine decarboxylase/phosphopantothenate--cysteine ligase CoaBC [Candidatus Limiplasma sp.]HRX08086.1 bifunctional phosphopantothenoylcysteine decarboxylase/phosphopantothenate--cysteine ligase CoaBC [Candidatus Limiplasma sp.]